MSRQLADSPPLLPTCGVRSFGPCTTIRLCESLPCAWIVVGLRGLWPGGGQPVSQLSWSFTRSSQFGVRALPPLRGCLSSSQVFIIDRADEGIGGYSINVWGRYSC